MLTEAEFVEQQRSLGRRIHEHDGVYWEEVYPFYCKPAFIYRAFDRGSAKPHPLRSLLGYSHQVLDAAERNRTVPFMVLERDGLDGFDLKKLPPKKRNNVRQAIARCEVKPMLDLDPFLERVREINIAQSLRQEAGAGAETPAKRYIDEAESWRAQVRREFIMHGHEWWGAFADGVLAAYLRTYMVDGTRVIQQVKADTAYFEHRPVDALYFHVLSACSADSACLRIMNGDPRHKSLNRFKKQFLFQPVSYPYYSSAAWMISAAKKFLRIA